MSRLSKIFEERRHDTRARATCQALVGYFDRARGDYLGAAIMKQFEGGKAALEFGNGYSGSPITPWLTLKVGMWCASQRQDCG
jgi:hypothetical protein